MPNGSLIRRAAPVPAPHSGTAPTWHLQPEFAFRARIPFKRMMQQVERGFDAGRSDMDIAQALQDIVLDSELLQELIDTGAPLSGSPLARPELIYENMSAWRLSTYRAGTAEPDRIWRIPAARAASGSWRSLVELPGSTAQAPAGSIPPEARNRAAALIRREHASVEITSPGGFRIIIDPIFRSPLLGCAATMPAPEPGLAAAFVTHSHSDHFDLATLEWLAADGTKIYVPPVPRQSLLSDDMIGQIRGCGLAGEVCTTGSLTQVGDITVEALPFFGEQPSARVSPADVTVRNWGNCYRVDTSAFSALFLTDSGADPNGSMLDAIADSVRRRGPIDVVLGCTRSMYMPFDVDGLSCYYVVLPMDGLRVDHQLYRRGQLPSSTLGVAGTAAACAEAGAKIYLPYAHGLTGYGQPLVENPFGPGPGLDERAACQAMAEELSRISCRTAVQDWNVGDRWTPGSSVLGAHLSPDDRPGTPTA